MKKIFNLNEEGEMFSANVEKLAITWKKQHVKKQLRQQWKNIQQILMRKKAKSEGVLCSAPHIYIPM